MFFFPVNEPEVQEIFNDSDNKFSSGDSHLSNILLKFIAPELISRLTRLMNMGLKKGFLPSELQRAKTIPIRKPGSKLDDSLAELAERPRHQKINSSNFLF